MTQGADGTFEWKGYNLAYSDFGSGDQVLVLMHGLLMNRHMFDRMAPEMASRGFRVITIDTLGHGASDRPEDMRLYNMPAFGDQIAALDRPPGARPPRRRRHVARRERRARVRRRPRRASRGGSWSRCPSWTTRSWAPRSRSRRCSWGSASASRS